MLYDHLYYIILTVRVCACDLCYIVILFSFRRYFETLDSKTLSSSEDAHKLAGVFIKRPRRNENEPDRK